MAWFAGLLAFGFGWLWWRYFKSGFVHSRSGVFLREREPINYWVAMTMFGIAILVMFVTAVWFVMLGDW